MKPIKGHRLVKLVVRCNDYAAKEIVPLLREMQRMGNIGASRSIVIEDWADSRDPNRKHRFGFDGDGPSGIEAILVDGELVKAIQMLKAGMGRERGGKYLKKYRGPSGKMIYIYEEAKDRQKKAVPGVTRHSLETLREMYRRKSPGQGQELPISSVHDLKLILDKTTFCFVSAGRNTSIGEKLSEQEVEERHQKLLGALQKSGYVYTQGTGKYGALEKSVLVMCHDANKKEMMALGTALNQDSVLFCENGHSQLIQTTGEKKGRVSMEGRGYDMVPKAEDYYTELKIGARPVKFTMKLAEVVQKALRLIWNIWRKGRW